MMAEENLPGVWVIGGEVHAGMRKVVLGAGQVSLGEAGEELLVDLLAAKVRMEHGLDLGSERKGHLTLRRQR
jgi:hypothetical protein